MRSGLGQFARKLFGSANDRQLKGGRDLVARVNGLEDGMLALDDAALAASTGRFRERLAAGAGLDELLPEAFAAVRESSRRVLGLRHFDVQIIGGLILHQGRIAEMKTGEGKTLVATLPAYLNALAGDGVHIVTVNEYLARRDAAWMGAVYGALGLSTGVVTPGLGEAERRAAYAADITYATNNELGFDYLRDNMKMSVAAMVQRAHAFAVVDEVDSILIDEARTPLIISGPTEDRTPLYEAVDALVPSLGENDFEIDEKSKTAHLTEEGNDVAENFLRERGLLESGNLYDAENASLVHHVNQALRAHKLYRRERDYIIRGDEAVIIDEFTGRMMAGRRFGAGLHQAIEAKERVRIQPENVTFASITFQNYFRMYGKLAGMTGTASTEAEEFREIYGLETVEVPTNKPMIRTDDHDQVFRTLPEKERAILQAIREARERGQPVLVGTTSIEKSEDLSERLKAADIPHNVLNARYHEQEAVIVAEAGAPGAVTIATNMAGRGTDIQLGGNLERRLEGEVPPEGDPAQLETERARIRAEVETARTQVVQAGGLWIIGTERHESRRIDNQLRGRSGRQGDPGRSTFFLSLEDDLMRVFGGDRVDGMLRKLGLEEDEAIVHPWVNKAIEKAQGKVEARNFDIRKNLLKYDDVVNDQRKVLFGQRREILEAEDLRAFVREMREDLMDDLVERHLPDRGFEENWTLDELERQLEGVFGARFGVEGWIEGEGLSRDGVRERLAFAAEELASAKEAEYGRETMAHLERAMALNCLDSLWREHLESLDHLRSTIGFRGYAQRNPLIEYKAEAFGMFESLQDQFRVRLARQMARVRIVRREPEAAAPLPPPLPSAAGFARAPDAARPETAGGRVASEPPAFPSNAGSLPNMVRRGAGSAPVGDPPADLPPEDRRPVAVRAAGGAKVGRNAPCPCGSGKKFKRCCGR